MAKVRPPVHHCQTGAFTLVELLVVTSVIALLISMLIPALSSARQQANATVCGSNIRQLAVANLVYAGDFQGQACPGAADFLKNLHRWHGTRRKATDPFDPATGPLSAYLGNTADIRRCPSFLRFRESAGAFELGNGGYGYNNAYIGRKTQPLNATGIHRVEDDTTGVALTRVRRPAETVMFTDTAFVSNGLIEYSFAEPPLLPTTGTPADLSIHFRHQKRASVAACDGHVTQETMDYSWSSQFYQGDPARFGVGGFGPPDANTAFDLN